MITKFRAWDKKNEAMSHKVRVSTYIDETMVEIANQLHWVERSFSDVILMQFTGLKDKNGVEIFEGDIVERMHLFNGSFGETHTGEIVYDKEYARYVISKPQKYTEPKTEDLGNILSDRSVYRVVGNVYQDRELLEVVE